MRQVISNNSKNHAHSPYAGTLLLCTRESSRDLLLPGCSVRYVLSIGPQDIAGAALQRSQEQVRDAFC